MSERSPISDATLLGRGVKGSFQSNIFLREDVCLWSRVFFNMGGSIAWMLTTEFFQINGLAHKKLGSIAVNEC